jgi:hypothetical protein
MLQVRVLPGAINVMSSFPHKTLLKHPWVKSALFSILSFLLFFLILDVLLIAFEPVLIKGTYQYDPHIGFRIRPYAVDSNRFGFNDRDYSLKKPDDVFRILILSDSFNWAGGREGNYTHLLEKKYEEYYGKHRVDVINAGYPKTHTAEQYWILKKFGMQYQPDLVVLGFFAGNDFHDAYHDRKNIVINGLYDYVDVKKVWNIFGYPIVLKSRILHFIKQRTKILRSMEKDHREPTEDKTNKKRKGTFNKKVFFGIERDRMKFYNVKSHRQNKFHYKIDYIYDSLDQIKSLLDSKGIEFLVAVYPDEFSVNPKVSEEVFFRYQLDPGDFDLRLAQKLLAGRLSEKGIRYVDLLDRFREQNEIEDLYLLQDTHWNKAGNRLAADVLFEALHSHVNGQLGLMGSDT